MALDELTRITENDIVPELEDLDGVASIQVAGQFVNEVQLKFNQDKLNELGLTEDTVKGIVQGSALYVPLGMFEMDKSQKAVAIDGGIIGIDDLKISLFRLFRAAAVQMHLPEPVLRMPGQVNNHRG